MKKRNIIYALLLAMMATLASCEYEYDMPDTPSTTPSTSEQRSIYSVTNSFGSKIKSDLQDAGCASSYYDVSYKFEEKNQSGTVINTVERSSISYTDFISAAGAAKVGITVSVTSYDKSTYKKALVYNYKFADVSLNPLKKTEITLSESMSYTRTKE